METCGTPYLTVQPSFPLPSRRPKQPPNPSNSPTISLLNSVTHPSHLPQIHGRLIKTNTFKNNYYLSKLLSLHIHHHLLDDARLLFDRARKPNALVFNTLLIAYVDLALFLDALLLFQCMHRRGVCPDGYTFPFILKACEDLSFGCLIHAFIIKIGLHSSVHVQNSVLSLYCRFCCIEDAEKVFDEMLERDVVSYTSMVSGYAKVGNVESAMEIFGSMSERDLVSWGAMISGLAQNGFPEEALVLFRDMQVAGFPPSEVAVVSAISSCGSLGLRSLGLWLHAFVIRSGMATTVFVGTALIDMYGKCGDLDNASSVFLSMNEKSVATWNSFIGGLAMNGSVAEALSIFEEMMRLGIEPNAVTLSNLLAACRHGGLVKEGQFYFNHLSKEFGVSPNMDHYGCMVDLLGRAGHVDEAFELIQAMPMEPNEVVWGALLGACKLRGNLELAEKSLQRLVELDPENGGNYVLLSNMYAELGRWDDVEKVRHMMRERSVEKTRGSSSIELDNVVQGFSAGDQSHHPSVQG